MRNKQQFLDDADKVLKEKFKDELNVLEDAAHIMNNALETTYTLPSEFTTTGKNELFLFDKIMRPRTDDPAKEIPDYLYIGRGE